MGALVSFILMWPEVEGKIEWFVELFNEENSRCFLYSTWTWHSLFEVILRCCLWQTHPSLRKPFSKKTQWVFFFFFSMCVPKLRNHHRHCRKCGLLSANDQKLTHTQRTKERLCLKREESKFFERVSCLGRSLSSHENYTSTYLHFLTSLAVCPSVFHQPLPFQKVLCDFYPYR